METIAVDMKSTAGWYPIGTGYIREIRTFALSVHRNDTSGNHNTINLTNLKIPICKASLKCHAHWCLQVIIIWSVLPPLSVKIVIFLKCNLTQISSQIRPPVSAFTEHLSSSALRKMRTKACICECDCKCSRNGIYMAELQLHWNQHYCLKLKLQA